MAVAPDSVTFRCYGVGFGDCFLLTFHYAGATGDRHMLFDFGTTEKPPKADGKLMKRIADDIADTVTGRLHAIVATHRHTDHVSGFATNKSGTAPGDVIAKLGPTLVIQPWTEELDLPEDFIGKGVGPAANHALRMSLRRMQDFTKVTLKQIRHLPTAMRQQIGFIGEDAISNVLAVNNLAAIGKKGGAYYVYHGKKVPKLATLFPGIKFDVIGPPTIKQKSEIKPQNPNNPKEYWNFAKFWRLSAATARLSDEVEPFPRAKFLDPRRLPVETRWLVQRLKQARARQLLHIVTAMDDALNNTSVILLMRAGSKKLVFPGDAQWENWEYAIKKNGSDLLDVDVYKVGHHGSLNATPKTLWNGFKHANPAKELLSVMSTVSHSKHGDPDSGTEVPREKLVTALREKSTLRTTQELEPSGDIVLKFDVDLR